MLEFRNRPKLLVMSSLYILGHGASFRSLRPLCHMSKRDCTNFFHVFLDAMNNMRDEFIHMPKNVSELLPITKGYKESGLPGCCGSMDVMHVQWLQCPTGDMNRAKGKESFPTVAFECVTNFNRQILGVYGPHFEFRNDKEIVKSDLTVLEVTLGWLSQVFWKYKNHRLVMLAILFLSIRGPTHSFPPFFLFWRAALFGSGGNQTPKNRQTPNK